MTSARENWWRDFGKQSSDRRHRGGTFRAGSHSDAGAIQKTYRENKNQKTDRKALALLAPFMDGEDLAECAREMLEENGNLKGLEEITLFMDEKDLG